MNIGKVRLQMIQRAYLRQHDQLIPPQRGHAPHQVIHRDKIAASAHRHNFLGRFFAQSAHITQSHPQNRLARAARLQGAQPIGAQNIDRPDLQPVPLGIFHQRGRGIKSHRLIVEQRRGEGRQVMALQISAGISQQRKAGGMRFGKSVERE